MPKTTNKNETQLFRLSQLFKNCPTDSYVSKEDIKKALKISDASVPVYIHGLKKKHGATIENVTKGHRTVIGYRLVASINVPQYKRTPSAQKKIVAVAPPPKDDDDTEIPILDKDVGKVSDRELEDTLSDLGIGSDGPFRVGDY